jgi:hypothetical protein
MKNKSELATTIFNYKTPEFFVNMKDIPPPKSEHRRDFVLEEKRKCREGININGIFICPELYFHLNYYHLEGDDLETGKKQIILPRLRDNEWLIFNDYHQCYLEKKIYPLFGARQIGKSEIETSLVLREICLFKQTEAMALFANSADRDTFTKKLSTAITHGESFIIIPNIDKDFNKDEIRFGFTRPDNTTEIRARLYVYNTQEGKKIQIGSGKSVSFLLMDEVAKSPFKRVYDVVEPALLSDNGKLRCSPIFAFTGGEVDKSKDAEDLVKNPTDIQFKTQYFDNNSNQTVTIGGRLLDGLYRKDCKEEKKFSEFIGLKTNTWLDDYTIYVSNKEKSFEKIKTEREQAAKSSEPSSLILKKIFFPLGLDDIFLTESNNRFNVKALKIHQEELKKSHNPVLVDLFRKPNGKVSFVFSDKLPISKFPVKPEDSKDSPVCIYEMPIENVPHGTYIIGIDPISNDDSNDREVSLASLIVYKRMISPLDAFKNQIVASWAGRFRTLEEWHELALMVAEFYNSVNGVIIEDSEQTLRQYFFHKRKSHYLADTSDVLSHTNVKYKGNKKFGLPATTPIQKHAMNLLIEYVNQEEIIVDDEGNEIMQLGLSKIMDTMLIEELINYKGKVYGKGVHDGNFDRIIATYSALVLAQFYDIKFPITQIPKRKPTVEEIMEKNSPQIKTPFGTFRQNTSHKNIPRLFKRF